MTNQEKKEYLQKYQAAVTKANRLDDEIKKWRSTAERTTTVLHMVPVGGGSGDRLQNAVEQIDGLTKELAEKRIETVRLRREIGDIIDAVSDEQLRALLQYRYIYGLTWEAIAVEMGCTERWIYGLHGRALSAITSL